MRCQHIFDCLNVQETCYEGIFCIEGQEEEYTGALEDTLWCRAYLKGIEEEYFWDRRGIEED